MATETVFVELKALIGEFQAKMAEARGEMTKTSEEGSSKFQSLSKVGGALLGGVATVAVGVAALSIKMGNDLEDSQAKLATALKGAGSSYEQMAGPISKADKAMENVGFTNAQTNDALAAGVVATGSASKALDLLQTAANLAAFKHISLADAMTTVAKASEGNLRPLKQLGIDLPVLASTSEKVAQAQKALAAAHAQLAAAQAAEHPTAAQIAADQIAAEKNALALQRASQAVTLAQQNVNAVLAKYPDAAKAGSKGHLLLMDASQKLKMAQEAQTIATDTNAAAMNRTGPHAKYEAALAKVNAAQQKLTDLQSAGGTIMDALNKKLGGQAASAADTFAGKLNVAKARTEDMLATLGMKLIPVVEQVIAVILQVVTWFEKHREAAITLGIVVGTVLVAAIGAYIVSMAAAAIATLAATWPILAIIAAVALIAVGIYELATHWSQVWGAISKVASDAWHWIDSNFVQPIMHFFETIADFIGNHWKLIVAIITGPVGLAIYAITTYWNDFMQFFASIPGALAGAGSDMWNWIVDGFKAAVDLVIGAWNWLRDQLQINFTLPSVSVGPVTFGGESFNSGPILPAIPYLEQGGLVTKTGLIYAHAGEAVTPMPKGAGGGGGDLVIQLDGREFARVAGPALRKWFEQGPSRNAVRGRLTT